MSELDQQLASDLQRMWPEPTRQPDWADVIGRAEHARPRYSWRPGRVGWAVAAGLIAVFLVVASVRLVQRAPSAASGPNTAIGVLDRPRPAGDPRPDLSSWNDRIAISANDLRFSQRVDVAGQAADLFLGRSGGALCLVMLAAPSGGDRSRDFGSCQPADQMRDDGLDVFSTPSATVGIVADGITRARARGTAVAVVNNTFVLPAGVDPDIEVLRGGKWLWRAPHFAIFDRPQIPDEAAVARQSWATGQAFDPSRLRIVIRENQTFYVIWRTDAPSVCLIPSQSTASWTTSCEDIDGLAAAGGLPVSVPIRGSGGRWMIAALVPDPVERVRVDGVESPVSDNVAATESDVSQAFELLGPDGAWKSILSAPRQSGADAGLKTSNIERTRSAQDDLPADVRARVGPAFGPPLRADSTYRAFATKGVTFWVVARGDGMFVVSSTGQLRVDNGTSAFTGGIQVVDRAPELPGSWPWSFGPAVAVPDGFTAVTIGATTVKVQHNLAVFPAPIAGDVVRATGPDRIVTIAR